MAKNTNGLLPVAFGPITFNRDTDNLPPLMLSQDIRGGLYTVANDTERDAIDGRLLAVNQIVYNTAAGRYERISAGTRNSSGFLTNITWSEFSSGGSGGVDVTQQLVDVTTDTETITVTAAASGSTTVVIINGVNLDANDFTLSGTQLTYPRGFANGDEVILRHFSPSSGNSLAGGAGGAVGGGASDSDTTYTAGTGLELNDTEFSIDSDWVDTRIDSLVGHTAAEGAVLASVFLDTRNDSEYPLFFLEPLLAMPQYYTEYRWDSEMTGGVGGPGQYLTFTPAATVTVVVDDVDSNGTTVPTENYTAHMIHKNLLYRNVEVITNHVFGIHTKSLVITNHASPETVSGYGTNTLCMFRQL